MSQNKPLPLTNSHIMVTRPAHQADALINLLVANGAKIFCQPLIEIIPVTISKPSIEVLKSLPQTDIAIFISQNAVTHGVNLINQYGGLASNLKLATVGLGSAKLLEQLTNRSVDIMPQDNYNSEGLLAHPELQNVANKRITIFRGIGGRTLLADTLRERGAQVEYAEVYQRQLPQIDLDQLETIWQTQPIDTICITSGEGLENLVSNILKSTAPEQLRADILNTQLVIVNKRLESLVHKHGFTKPPIITDNVSDKAIVDAIIKNRD